MDRSLAEAAELCLNVLVQEDSNLKAAVMLSAFEHEYLINPNGESIQAKQLLSLIRLLPSNSLVPMIENERFIPEEDNCCIVQEKILDLHNRLWKHWGVDAKQLFDKLMCAKSIFVSLKPVALVLDRFSDESVSYKAVDDLFVIVDGVFLTLHMLYVKQVHISYLSSVRQWIVHLIFHHCSQERIGSTLEVLLHLLYEVKILLVFRTELRFLSGLLLNVLCILYLL